MLRAFTLNIICALAIAAATPTHTLTILPNAPLTAIAQPTHVEIHEPTLAKVGDVVESVPTAVSHQSSTIVHSKAQRITPLMTPAVRTYRAPAISTTTFTALPLTPLLRAPLPLGFVDSAAAAAAQLQLPSQTDSVQMRSFGPTSAAASASPFYHRYSYGLSYGGGHVHQPLVYAYANAA